MKPWESKKGTYKRYTGSPLRYAGGKSLAIGYITELLPADITSITSPFIGGGSVEVALAKELNIKVDAYDVFDLLVNFWQQTLTNPKALASTLNTITPTTSEYKRIKSELHQAWTNMKPINNKIKLAAYYYFNHNTSYGPGFLGWPSSVYMNQDKWLKMIDKVKEFDVPNLQVNQATFQESISQSNDFIYADPPYYLGHDSKMFKGIYPQRNFPIHHDGFDHEALRDLLLNHKQGFLLSYNDCPIIREWYVDCEIYEPTWQYTMGQGETRIGANRSQTGDSHIKKSHELLIRKLPVRL